MSGPRIDSYDWPGGREPMLRFGPATGPTVALALPLFEEANRTRAFGVAILRALAEHGVVGLLPELPGQGESLLPTSDATLANIRAAFADIGASFAITIRGGCLLPSHLPTWMLSPQSGADLLRELARIKAAPLIGDPVEIAGNLLSQTLLAELAPAEPPPGRVVRLTSDPQPADRHIAGQPLWRRAEPGDDVALAQALAADIAEWIRTCAA